MGVWSFSSFIEDNINGISIVNEEKNTKDNEHKGHWITDWSTWESKPALVVGTAATIVCCALLVWGPFRYSKGDGMALFPSICSPYAWLRSGLQFRTMARRYNTKYGITNHKIAAGLAVGHIVFMTGAVGGGLIGATFGFAAVFACPLGVFIGAICSLPLVAVGYLVGLFLLADHIKDDVAFQKKLVGK